MGKTFGNLYYIRNIVYYKVSSYEQRAFANFWKDSLRSLFYESRSNLPFILPPFVGFYLYYRWGVAERERLIRKPAFIEKLE